MRVLFVEKAKIGGVNIHIEYVKKELEKRGTEVDVITRNEDLKLPSFISSYRKLKELYEKWSKEYDIIHAHDWSIAYPAVKANIKNLIVTLHGSPANPLAKYFEDHIVKKLGKRVVVISPKMLKKYPETTYIPNGVDLDLFKRYENIERENYLAGIFQKYNSDKIIKILRKLKINYIQSGAYPYEELPKLYNQISIFISLPPKYAGFNMVWLEATACEVPYIIGSNYGIGEILPIYKVNNFEELEIILNKIKNEELPELRGLREWIVKNNLTWTAHAEKLIKLYSSII
ncbi:glycosyl transferase group 1 [Nanobdella aerobiophila]|uniref:Glycosyl transferase group 1 n=1 Tax=Nanobdella aerobiophila TaxID=2586965 RepID=A0A915SI65_9ARCH|nr:glycosyltransferase family 4 protein [Nanobdella aerobiophila]BBL45437.1 glycosyl transferase group 1 [Nanobdella aerobiophila]